MEVTFGEADHAAVCNSEKRMVRRWGREGFEYIGRRLLELTAAADLDQVAALPGAAVTRDEGEGVTIIFDRGQVVIKAQLVKGAKAGRAVAKMGSDGLHIASLVVRLPVRTR